MKEHAITSGVMDRRRQFGFRRVCKWLVMSVALIVAAAAAFQFFMTLWDSHRYPAPGKLVDIGGLRLHINCTGMGGPAVIMEAGPNDSSIIWQLVQPQISKFARVCSYDRAGFGWSDAPNEPRSSLNIANELARLLTRAAVPDPYVLVGHDFGTLDLRVFTARHSQEVVGMVFVDSVHPDIHHRPPFNVAAQSTAANISYHLMPWAVLVGVPRIFGWCRDNFTFPNQPQELARLVPEATAQYCRLQSWRAEEAQLTDENGSFYANTGPLGAMPLIVLSHDPRVNDFGGFFSPADLVKAERSWMEMQDELRGLSSRSQRKPPLGANLSPGLSRGRSSRNRQRFPRDHSISSGPKDRVQVSRHRKEFHEKDVPFPDRISRARRLGAAPRKLHGRSFRIRAVATS